ncbi:MAG: hypothetical protein P4L33_06855 [Capsulimonadaceae bacterium]|nr:hypothetical protein [Capsulimonadaceae bacterium]
MATKTADTHGKTKAAPIDIDALADAYLTHQIHHAIASLGEPAKIADIARAIDDEAISLGLIRHTLTRTPSRFIPIDRRWDVSTRYLDKQRPAQRLLEEIVSNFDAPVSAWDAAHEFATVSGRTAEGVLVTVERMLRGSKRFTELTVDGNSRYVPASWLLDTNVDYLTDEQVLFYNFLGETAAKPFKSVSLDWVEDPVGSVEKLLHKVSEKAPRIIENRLVQFLAFKALGEDFDARALYATLLETDRLVVFPGHRWIDPETVQTFRNLFIQRANDLADLPEEEIEVEEAAPLIIGEDELIELDQTIEEAGDRGVRTTTLLQDVYEIAPGDRTFSTDVQTLFDALRAHPDRFDWVGYDRFRLAGSLPPYIGQVPESLRFPVIAQIETPEGDLLDQMLDGEGFERGLEREVLNSLAQDVNDQEPTDQTVWPEGVSADSQSIELVLKAHHKEIGTFPMCQIPFGFLATEPSVVEITFRDKSGNSHQVFADYNTQLLYGLGLFDLYAEIPAESGAIIRIEKTNIPGEFLFTATGDTHADVFVAPERLEQLQNYRSEIEAGPTLSTHDIVRFVLEHSNSTMSYLTLLTEVNIVRRVTRRQLASILSAWSGFAHRSGTWSYDAKKAAQGFNKSRRKYAL